MADNLISSSEEILSFSNEEIIDIARQSGMTDPSYKVVGIFFEAGLDLIRAPTLVGPSAGVEYMRFVGVDTTTRRRVVADYAGVTAGANISLIPRTTIGGGAFGFTGEVTSLGGFSAGVQMSTGVTGGTSVNLDGSGVLTLDGNNSLLGINAAGGYTFRVTVNDYTIFHFGSEGQTFFDQLVSQEQIVDIFRADGLYGSGETRVNVVLDGPSGQRVIEYTYAEYPIASIDEEGRREVIAVSDKQYDADGNLVSEELSAFRAKSSGPFEEIKHCFPAGTPITMADRSEKPIDRIKVDDWVTATDKDGNLVPGRVTHVWSSEVPFLLDLHGTETTPGHAFLCGDGPHKSQYRPVIQILLEDGALVRLNGDLIRASTGCLVGSELDRKISVLWTDDKRFEDPNPEIVRQAKSDAELRYTEVRLGSWLPLMSGVFQRAEAFIEGHGWTLMDDGLVDRHDGGPPGPLHFWGHEPKPEAYVLAMSTVTLEEIMGTPECLDEERSYADPGYITRSPQAPVSAATSGISLGTGYSPPEALAALSGQSAASVSAAAVVNPAPKMSRQQRRKAEREVRKRNKHKGRGNGDRPERNPGHGSASER
ncbi:MAG: hypothetical protein Kilf2KO_04720 [Rhodospirillales bacterium]